MVSLQAVLVLQQQAALLARGARRHDSRKSEVSAVAEDLLNASHAHKYASGGELRQYLLVPHDMQSTQQGQLCCCSMQALACRCLTER